MKKYYRLENLDCPNCAAELAGIVKKIKGVKDAEIDFINLKLMLETDSEDSVEVLDAVKKAAYDFERVEVLPLEKNRADSALKENLPCAIRIALAAVLLALAAFLPVNKYLSLGLYIAAYLAVGYDVIWASLRNIFKGKVFDENFLMTLATVGAFALGEFGEGVFVMLFYQVGELFQRVAVGKSRKSIADMMDLKSEYANLLVDGVIQKTAPENVEVGSLIVVKPGERIPLDGVITDGSTSVDTAALTGESKLFYAEAGDAVMSGSVNIDGLITVKTTKTYSDGTVSKILDLVENSAMKKAPSEKFITKFAKIYTPAVVCLAALIAFIPPLFGASFSAWIEKALIFLMVSCPCALVVSVPLSFFAGIGCAAKRGVLVKGGNYLEILGLADTAVFDKTGTLTEGRLRVSSVMPRNIGEEEFIEIAAALESGSNHPIARAVLEKYARVPDAVSSLTERAGYGITAEYKSRRVLLGNSKLMGEYGVEFEACNEVGTVIYMAVDGEYKGCMVITDTVKPGCRQALAALKNSGVSRTVMLTGDGENFAEKVAEEVGADEYYAQLLPADKVEKATELMKSGRKIMFTGDGINDAPVLAIADVGIAMGALGSDAAIEAADVVIMDDDICKLSVARKIAKKTVRIVKQNIVFAIAVKAAVMALSLFGLCSMWQAIFADVGVMVLAVLNSLRCMKYGNKKSKR